MAEVFVPYRVYQNCAVACEYRGGKVTSALLTEDKFTSELNAHGYVTLAGERTKTESRPQTNFTFVIVTPESTSVNRAQDFKKLVKSVVPKRTTIGPRVEIIIIADQEIKYLINDTDDVQAYRNNGIYMYGYLHEYFLIELPKYMSIPQYRLATNDEKTELRDKFFITPAKLTILRFDDPVNSWYGFDKGSILNVRSLSETAGIALQWCIVK